MPLRIFTDAQREGLSGFPARLDPETLDRFFTLSDADVAEISHRRRDDNRLGWALQLCGLRMLGFCPDDVTTTPASAVAFVARQLGVDPSVLAGYGARPQARTGHMNQVKEYLGFRSPAADDLDEVRDWLATEALAQDRPIVLFHMACERLYQLGLARPGLTTLERSLVAAARDAAREETARRVAPLLSPERRRQLDELLEVDAKLGSARATWLRHLPVQASPNVFHDEMDKLAFLRDLGADEWDMSVLPAKRSPSWHAGPGRPRTRRSPSRPRSGGTGVAGLWVRPLSRRHRRAGGPVRQAIGRHQRQGAPPARRIPPVSRRGRQRQGVAVGRDRPGSARP